MPTGYGRPNGIEALSDGGWNTEGTAVSEIEAINDNVNPPTAGDTSDYIATGELDAYIECTFSDLPANAASVNSIRFWMYAASETDPSTNNIAMLYHKDGGSYTYSSKKTTATPSYYYTDLAGSYTVAEFNALIAGAQVDIGGQNIGNYIYTMCLEVDYTETTGRRRVIIINME